VDRRHSFRIGHAGLLIIGGIATMMFACYLTPGVALAAQKITGMPSDTGIHDLSFATGSGDTMRYSLSLPATMPRDGTQALVVVLHYGGPPSEFYGRPLIEQLVGPALAALNAVMIAPVTLDGDWSNADNDRAVLEILAEVERVYVTDPRRRVITGYSMGGAGTWLMLARHPGYFSAAIPISGFKTIAPDSCTTPLYALHSNADSIFDADELRGLIDVLQSAGCEARAEFIDDVDHFDIAAFAPLLERTVPWLRELWARAG